MSASQSKPAKDAVGAAVRDPVDDPANHPVDDSGDATLQRLRDSESQLRIAGRIARVGAWSLDVAGQVVTWSDVAAEIQEVGDLRLVTPAEAAAFYAPEHRDRIIAAVTACVVEGRSFDEEYEIVTPSGRRVWARSIGEPVRDESGRVVRVQGAFQDISATKRAESELLDSASRLRSVLESLTDGFFTLNREWRVTYLNKAGEKLLRRRSEELVGRTLGHEYPDAAGDIFVEHYRRAMATGQVIEFEAPYPPLGLWLEVRVHPTTEGLAVSMHDVTERRREREELRQSVERFRGVARATSDAIWDWNVEEDTTWWSEGVETLFGHSIAELQSNTNAWLAYIHEDDRIRVLGSLYNILQSGAQEWSHEYRFGRKDGSWAWVLDRGFVIRDSNGRAMRMVGGMTDQTEQREAELELARLNRALRMRSAFNESLIRATDERELLTEVCRIAVEMGGYRMAWVGYAQDDDSRSIRPVAHAGFEDGYLSEVSLSWSESAAGGRGPAGRVVRSGKPDVLEDLVNSPAQTPWHDRALDRGYHGIVSLPLRNRDDTLGLLGLYTSEVRPIADDEVALLQNLADDLAFGVVSLRSRRERERMQVAVSKMASVVSASTTEEFFQQLVRSMCEALGADGGYVATFPPDEPGVARTIASVLDGSVTSIDDRPRDGWPCADLLAADEVVIASGVAASHPALPELADIGAEAWVGRRLDDPRGGPVGFVAAFFREPLADVGFATSTLRIFAARATAELERSRLENQLREAQKMEAIGTLAGGIAHDFNNILGAILGNTELARLEVGGNALALESLEEIRRSGLRAKELIRQILSFSRRETTVRRPVEILPIIEESVRLLRATMPSRAPIRLVGSPDLPQIQADPVQIQQVLLNLGTNALHAMTGRAGSVEIRVDRVELDASSTLRHRELTPGTWVRLSVIDSGHGMDEPTRQRIFEPFFTTKPVGEGTGLGLPVVHGILRDHEGVVVVESKPGIGTRFDLYFPATAAVADVAVARIATEPVATGRGGAERTILYVDDDPSLLSIVRRLLEYSGYEVVGHEEARSALDELQRDPGRFDLVLTDFNMPRMSGLDVARAVQQIRAGLPVVVTSGYITEAMRADAEAAGVRSLIFKPDIVTALRDEIARILGETAAPIS